jgi:hypothetical protein
MAVRQPAAALRGYVRQYAGWFEHMAAPLLRRELPTDEVPVIISFGAPIRVYDAGDSSRFRDLGSFATGAYDAYVRVLSSGPSGGIQINFTILGARLFLARPLSDLRNQSVSLDCVLGAAAPRLESELYDAPTWDARFDILDREIGARILAAPKPGPEVFWTWRRLVETGGQVGIDRMLPGAHRPDAQDDGARAALLARRPGAARADAATLDRPRARLRLLRSGALHARFPRIRRRHPARAPGQPAARRRRHRGRLVRFVQDPTHSPSLGSDVEVAA